MVTIDLDKCIGCEKCVLVCPFTILDMKDGKPIPNSNKRCLECMHCAAICPQNAIGYGDKEGILPRDYPKFPENLPKILEGYLMTRRSYRHFIPTAVPMDIMNHAIWVSDWAPSAKNQHPTKWIVINDDNKIRQMMDHILEYVKETGLSSEILEEYNHGNNVVVGTAKTLLLAYASTKAINPPVDSALALHTVELILQSKGIGTCWAGYLTRMCNQIPALQEMLKLPEGFQVYGALMVGYTDNEAYNNIPQRLKKSDAQWL